MKKLLLAFFSLAFLFSAKAQTLPSTYVQQTIVSGLQYPVDWDWTGDGRYFITQKGGTSSGSCANAKVLVYSAAGTLIGTFCDLTDSIQCGGERGLLGIAIDPNFATNHFVYTFYVHQYGSAKEIRVLRWTEAGNVGVSNICILKLNLNALGFTPQPYHYSGIIRFRATQPNQIYVQVGEMYHNQTDTTAGANFGQMLNKPYGKILRINTDGTIPTDNPFYDDGNVATGNDDRIWSYGHRNMFGMCVNPVNDSLYEAENGLGTWDELNVIHKGGNYGWNHCEGNYYNSSTSIPCPFGSASSVLPITTWGAPLPAITGALFYSGTVMPEFNNHMIIADNDNGILYDLTMGNAPAYDIVTSKVNFADVASGSSGLTTIRQGPDGCIYCMKGGYTTTGTIFRICHVGVGIASNTIFENRISQNYPNPTNGKTQIDYTVNATSTVSIELFDVTGRMIKTVVSGSVEQGDHTAQIDDLDKVANGSYFYKMDVKQNGKLVFSETKRLTVVK